MKLSEKKGVEEVICETSNKRRLKAFYVAGNESFVSNANALSAPQGEMTGHPGGKAGEGVNLQSPEAMCGVRGVSHITSLSWPGSEGNQGHVRAFSVITKEPCNLPLSGGNWCSQHYQRQFRALLSQEICTLKEQWEGNTFRKKKVRGKSELVAQRRDFWARSVKVPRRGTPFSLFNCQGLGLGGRGGPLSPNSLEAIPVSDIFSRRRNPAF